MIARRSISFTLVWLCAIVGALAWWSASASAQRVHVFSKSFAVEGSGEGQLMRPGELAVSEVGPMAGDVYVVDRGNSRVEIFSSSGTYVGQFNGSSSPTGVFSWPGSEKPEGAIAVDNSTDPLDPSAGDVYVADMGHKAIDKFTPSGSYIGQLTGPPTTRFQSIEGVAVDPSGALWVRGPVKYEVTKTGVNEFNDAVANEFISETVMRFRETLSEAGELSPIGLAIDSQGNFYFGHLLFGESGESSRHIAKFNSAGTLLEEEVGGEALARGVAVDRSSDDVYVDNETSVSAFTPTGIFIERFGAAQMGASAGIAADASTGAIYVSDVASQSVDVFSALTVPDVSTGTASNLGETSATVAGTVDPDGLPVTSCEFEYGTTNSYGQTADCSPAPGSGSAPVTVSAGLTGLESLTRYHFRLKVANANGSIAGQDRTYLTPVPVTVQDETVSDVSATSAQFAAQVNPGGADTKFRFEYGTSTAYGQSVPVRDGDLGAGTGLAPVGVRPEDLQSDTTYHVRIVATNLLGTVYGPDETFTTEVGGAAFALPDGRVWELVSPPNKFGAGIEPVPREGVVEAAENGSAITYLANGPTVASAGGNASPARLAQVLSTRVAGGWSSQDVTTPSNTVANTTDSSAEFLAFSPSLSSALVEPPGDTPLAPEASEKTVYVRDDTTESYLPLVTAANVPAGTAFGGAGFSRQVHGLAATPDFSHVLLESEVPLTSNAVRGKENLYEWSNGTLTLVSVLKDGTPVEGANLGANSHNIRHALSNDGSRVFFKGDSGLYMRDTVSGQTVQVDAPEAGIAAPGGNPTFQFASADGGTVFFLDGEPLTAGSRLPIAAFNSPDMYVYDTETGRLDDLTVDTNGGEQADVQAVLGGSEDGSIVYFVASGALAPGAEAGGDNLYMVSQSGSTWGAPRLLAVLSPEDARTWMDGEGGMAARVSPNGRFVAFMSQRSLTGYDNRDLASGAPDEEVFLYNNASGQVHCVSCDSTGVRPSGILDEAPRDHLFDRGEVWSGHWLAAEIPGWDRTDYTSLLGYQTRYLNNEGRLFFDGFGPLVQQDTNGTADVYEYEPIHVGSCEEAEGCVSLISSGTSSEESVFLDASGMGPGGEEGEDVFFLTAARLTGLDYDTGLDVYDAHMCSQSVPCTTVPVASPACTSGDSCKAAPSPQPAIFGAPASATFAGAGNLSTEPAAKAPVKTGGAKGKHRTKRTKRRSTHRRKARRARNGGLAGRLAHKNGRGR